MPGGSVVAGDAAPICKAATILLILPPGLPKTAVRMATIRPADCRRTENLDKTLV